MLTNKQIKILKKEAHHLDPIFQIGKNGVSDELIKQIDSALEKRELIKLNILNNSDEDLKEAAEKIARSLRADVVQTIGRVMVLFRASSEVKNQRYSSAI